MTQLLLRYLILGLAAVAVFAMPASGTNFSCSFGKRGACLDYDDKVCSSSAKCVDRNAVCFSSFTCSYEGFVCKSKLDDVVDKYDDLASRCKEMARGRNGLVTKYNELASSCKRVAGKNSDLVKNTTNCSVGIRTLGAALPMQAHLMPPAHARTNSYPHPLAGGLDRHPHSLKP